MKTTVKITIISLISLFVWGITGLSAQTSLMKNETYKVYGNCDMCKKTIEKAGNKKKIATVVWDKNTHLATLTYDSKKTSPDEILKQIALAGYDNEKFFAPDDVYAKLHGCCQYERPKIASISNQDTLKETKNLVNNQKTNQLTNVFANYFLLKDALVNSDGNLASEKAKILATAINEVKMEKLSGNEHTVWMKIIKDLTLDAEHIAETKDVSHQRAHFMTLSKKIYELIKVSKSENAVYYQFCPMANDGKGANWLSKENAIKNPYYGSQMLTCGKTVETIK